MPIYEYSCEECRTGFEELVLGSAPVSCPGCGSARVLRQMSVTARPPASGGAAAAEAAPGCGRCGDPRGPGACAMN